VAGKSEKNPTDDILKVARERFKLAEEAESDNRKVALDDIRFRAGEQWPDDVKQARSYDRRPCLTINRIPQFVRQITNDQRQNRPSIKVHPLDNQASAETAKVLEGMFRHIEYNSNADTAYDTAFDAAVTHGRGFFRVVTDYCHPTSFDQELLIKAIPDPFCVYFDPFSVEPDGSDAEWAMIIEDTSVEAYKRNYPETELASMSDLASIGNMAPGWASKESVRIAEYYYKEYKEREIVLLTDGNVFFRDKLPEDLPPGVQEKGSRKTLVPVVKWCKINAVEIIEETEWAGSYIPVIPAYGEVLTINGKRIFEGVIRHAKDPQRMYNYWASAETETIALAPRAPFIVAEGQLEGREKEWKESNVRNHAFLTYKAKTVGGQMAPPPQRQVFEAPVQAITQARMQASDDMKATTGIYDSALGNRSNENSGVAIQRRNNQSQTSNFHFVDNLTRSLRHCGRICIEMMPVIYDTAQATRIVAEDGSQEVVTINQMFNKDGKQTLYQLNKGQYDAIVETGPSFATKRQEAAASMMDMSKAAPQLMQIAGDIIIKNMDWPGAQEIADRIKKSLPPQFQDNKDAQQPIPPQLQAHLQQQDQMIHQLSQQLEETTETIKTRRMELESKERIATMQTQAELEIALAKIGSAEGLTLLRTQIDDFHQRLDRMFADKQMQEQAEAQEQPDQGNEPGSGPAGAAMPNETQPPTGGSAPGQPME
jgi:hypothetical protein